jgi:AmmeMemoRadiSam system protein B
MSVIRMPAFAGLFYPAEPSACELAVTSLFDGLKPRQLHGIPRGGLVPHAGWAYSGRVAALTVQAVARATPDVVVVFGAVHVRDLNRASVFDAGVWRTPAGDVNVDEELAAAVVGGEIVADTLAHRHEHSIEVELPLIRHAMPGTGVLPLMVRPGAWSRGVGVRVAEAALRLGRRAVFLASTDLTHYGPRFDFEPAGRGAEGLRWAKEVNDRRFLTIVQRREAGEVVPEAEGHWNACGAGAVAAAIAAAGIYGCDGSTELKHTTSAEVRPEQGITDSVGYASLVFHKSG